jgi:hypothetical protein
VTEPKLAMRSAVTLLNLLCQKVYCRSQEAVIEMMAIPEKNETLDRKRRFCIKSHFIKKECCDEFRTATLHRIALGS